MRHGSLGHGPRGQQLFEQLTHRPAENGMHRPRRDFGQRLQNEQTFVHSRVRDGELRQVDHLIVEEQ